MLNLQLAFRNLFRHKARLALNLLLLIGAFTAIVVFKGFKVNVLNTIRDIVIDTQMGHIQIGKEKFWTNAPFDHIKEKMIENPASVVDTLKRDPDVKYASPRIGFYGLINAGDKSVPGHLIGFDASLETRMQARLNFLDGKSMSQKKQIIIGSGLQHLLKVKSGEEVTIVTPTLEGSLNAMDVVVSGVFQTGTNEVDSSTAFLDFSDSQRLLDTDYADSVFVVLNDLNKVSEKKDAMVKSGEFSNLKPKSWRELADLFLQVENFYNFQNYVVEGILVALLVLSIANTVSMSVFERTGEIGTLRALGDYESDIVKMFLLESAVLGGLAIVIAIPVSACLILFVSSLHIPLVLPMATRAMDLTMTIYFGAYFEAAMICLLSIIVAAILPSCKGSKMNIVDALRAKI